MLLFNWYYFMEEHMKRIIFTIYKVKKFFRLVVCVLHMVGHWLEAPDWKRSHLFFPPHNHLIMEDEKQWKERSGPHISHAMP